MKKIIVLIIVVLLAGFNYTCNDEWFEVKPKGQADFTNFLNAQGVQSLLIAAYADVDGCDTWTTPPWASSVSNWIWGSADSDDAYKGSDAGDQSDINATEDFTLTAANSYVEYHWIPFYDGITRCNDVLKALREVTNMSNEEKILAEAQAKFLRAHFYFELTIVHGKVPYIDENTENPGLVANDHLLWPEMEADMKFAADNLPDRWSDKGRATEWAAKTYLARIYMFQQKFAEAMPLLQDVYTNGGFSLVPSYEMNYMIANINNSESIFEIQYAVNDVPSSVNAGLGDGINFPHGVPGMGLCCGFFQASHSLVSAHRVDDNGLPLLDDTYSADDILPYSHDGSSVLYTLPVDPRLDHTVGRPGVPFLDWGIQLGDSWIRDPNWGGPYLFKKNMFKKSEKDLATKYGWPNGVSANNFRKYRLGHVILWLAECEAEVGSLHNATTLVNEIRNRAKNSNVVTFDDGTPAANYKVEPYPVDFPSKDYARKAIRHEIRIEFAMEGLRFFDLVRWGIAAEVLNNYLSVEGTVMVWAMNKQFTAGQHEIRPIPQSQIDISRKDGQSVLVQNPGY
jgi:hypothetical protein